MLKEQIINNPKNTITSFREKISKRKKLLVLFFIISLVVVVISARLGRQARNSQPTSQTVSVPIQRTFDFPGLDNQGRPTDRRLDFKLVKAEKTNQVLVKDQVFTARNNKLFLIINLEYQNIDTVPLNIIPGDLVRLSINGDENTKFAADLHNNLVLVSAISTKTDRLGFVIPKDARVIKLYVGELEGEKQIVSVNFPS